MRYLISLLLLATAGTFAQEEPPAAEEQPAMEAQAAPAVAARTFAGPVTITADTADLLRHGRMVYTGRVRLQFDGMDLRGNRLELRQLPDNHFEAHLTGAPARFRHAAEDGVGPEVNGEAQNINYDSISQIADLSGGVQLTRGTDSLAGDTLRYETAARRIIASGGAGGQVRIVIQPPRDDPPQRPEPAPQP
jgi:lipopolysaccharide export system protein LptA